MIRALGVGLMLEWVGEGGKVGGELGTESLNVG